MYFQFAASFLVIGIALFIVYIIVLAYSNSLLDNVSKSHFRNSFPYNFYMSDSIVMRVVLYVLLGLGTLMTCVGEAFFFISFNSSFMLILGIALPLSLLFIAISNVIPLSYYKLHLVFSLSGFCLFGGSGILLAFVKVIPNALGSNYDFLIFLSVMFGFLGFVSLLSLLNPKLSSWAKMDKTEEDGKTYYVKPKINFYALYEWIFLAEEVLAAFLCFLNIILTNSITIA